MASHPNGNVKTKIKISLKNLTSTQKLIQTLLIALMGSLLAHVLLVTNKQRVAIVEQHNGNTRLQQTLKYTIYVINYRPEK